ncbi:MAG: hypothetical protein LC795_23250 [Acidobacteria bacterium]|nr:hypothetical protein [Acidobacteriota bacterium]
MNDAETEKVSPFACDMNAIEASQRGQHIATIDGLFRAVEEIRELSNGYAFRLPNESDVLIKAAKFIALERLCCPFFGFTLEAEPEVGSLWLSLIGREGVKPFIVAEIGDHLIKSLAVSISDVQQ